MKLRLFDNPVENLTHIPPCSRAITQPGKIPPCRGGRWRLQLQQGTRLKQTIDNTAPGQKDPLPGQPGMRHHGIKS